MTDMLDRAAKAMCASQLYGSAWDSINGGAQNTYRANARAALLAALDPEDEKLVEAVARSICAGDPDRVTHPRMLSWTWQSPLGGIIETRPAPPLQRSKRTRRFM